MGCSLSPVLANIFMEHFETHLVEDIPEELKPVMWLRYVDDVLCIFEDMQKFDSYLEHLNRVRPSIQFTYELSRMITVANGPSDLPDNVVESIPMGTSHSLYTGNLAMLATTFMLLATSPDHTNHL